MSKLTYKLLAITDRADHSWKMTMPHRKSDDETYALDIGSGSLDDLKGELAKLVAAGMIFQNLVFTTHGNSGVIFFGDAQIGPIEWYSNFYRSGFEKLFPFQSAKIYFAGCNVAEGDAGWRFLQAAAMTFLRYGGGSATGWTSSGYMIPTWFPHYGGHLAHFTGDSRSVMFLPGSANDGGYFTYYEDWNEVAAPY